MHTTPEESTAFAQLLAESGAMTGEEYRVHVWRFDQLRRAGYSEVDALALADDTTIGLDGARRLVLQRGCPPHLAAQILL